MIKEVFEQYMMMGHLTMDDTPAIRKIWVDKARASFDHWYRSLPEDDKEAVENRDEQNDYNYIINRYDDMWLEEREHRFTEKDWDELAFGDRQYNDPDADLRHGRKTLEKLRDYACDCIEKGIWPLQSAVEEVFADVENEKDKTDIKNFAFKLADSNGKDMSLADMLRQVKRYADMNDPSYERDIPSTRTEKKSDNPNKESIMNYDITIGNEAISFSELQLVDTEKYPYAVTLTDTFLAGWGKAAERKAKFIHLCTNREMAEKMKDYANSRSDTKEVNIKKTSNIDKSFFTSARVGLKCPSELPAWTAGYRKYASLHEGGKDVSELQNELDLFDGKNNPFPKIEKLRRLWCIKNNYVFDRSSNCYVNPEGTPEKHPYCSDRFDLGEYKDYIKIVYANRLEKSGKLPSIKLAANFAKLLYKDTDPKELSKQMIEQGLKDEASISDFFSTCKKEVLHKNPKQKKEAAAERGIDGR